MLNGSFKIVPNRLVGTKRELSFLVSFLPSLQKEEWWCLLWLLSESETCPDCSFICLHVERLLQKISSWGASEKKY